MISIVTDKTTRGAIGTNALLNIAHRLLNEYRDEKTVSTVEIVRHGAGAGGGTLVCILRREDNGKITETWGREACLPGALPNTTKTS